MQDLTQYRSLKVLLRVYPDAWRTDFSQVARVPEAIQINYLALKANSIGSGLAYCYQPTFNRFRRIVRDVSQEMGKSIELEIHGGDTELDKTIVEKLSDPLFCLSEHADKLVVLDQIQRTPELFATLRGLIDAGRRRGRKFGRFLLLGSASADLRRQSETLAGRIAVWRGAMRSFMPSKCLGMACGRSTSSAACRRFQKRAFTLPVTT